MSLIDADGSESVPVVNVNPFDAVSNPPNVPVDCVENAPVDVVVAFPLIQRDPESERFVVEAAPLNCWSCDHELAVVVPKAREKVRSADKSPPPRSG